MKRWGVAAGVLLTSVFAAGCANGGASKFPARAEGCAVDVSAQAPTGATENIGPVSAWCDLSLPDAECVRALQDQVCKLGGDVVWGVDPKPIEQDGRKHLTGRAAKKLSPGT